jgi:hypothetical protein
MSDSGMIPARFRCRSLGQRERLHVVSAAAVEVAEPDPALERNRVFPEGRKRPGDVDVVEQQESTLPTPSGEANEEVAAAGGGTDHFVLDPVAVEEVLQEFSPRPFPPGVGRLQPDVVVEEVDRLELQPLGRGAGLILFEARFLCGGLRLYPTRRDGANQEKREKRPPPHARITVLLPRRIHPSAAKK